MTAPADLLRVTLNVYDSGETLHDEALPDELAGLTLTYRMPADRPASSMRATIRHADRRPIDDIGYWSNVQPGDTVTVRLVGEPPEVEHAAIVSFITARLDDEQPLGLQQRSALEGLRTIAGLHGYYSSARPIGGHPRLANVWVAGQRPHATCMVCGGEGLMESVTWPCLTLCTIAGCWMDHPDYRPEWAA